MEYLFQTCTRSWLQGHHWFTQGFTCSVPSHYLNHSYPIVDKTDKMKPCFMEESALGISTENREWLVMMSTLSSVVAPEVVFMTTSGATTDDKIGIYDHHSSRFSITLALLLPFLSRQSRVPPVTAKLASRRIPVFNVVCFLVAILLWRSICVLPCVHQLAWTGDNGMSHWGCHRAQRYIINVYIHFVSNFDIIRTLHPWNNWCQTA